MKFRLKLIPLTAALALALVATACGKSETPAPAAESAPAAEAPPVAAAETAPAPEAANATPDAAVAGDEAGKKTYGATCALCHASALAGAPKPGDKVAWGPRIAQGKDTLYTHALEGYTGNTGVMPARGGNASLSDDDVKAAVDFMVAQSQ
ncbi:c-type cytochrome [Thermomonas sp.]|uniref:c-type cytochrome n=1 Tax=Thermomonas sp. TaxID=1971895 RepID=UPI002C28A6ED|nr:c-type cytochrome [Thermomonas sp.]HRO62846.1 c-type cytochrome [Thermomonas sp.]